MPQDTRSISFGHSVPQMPESRGHSYILTIGIDKYHDLPPLRNAVKDAKDVTALLTSKYQFEATHVTTLFDSEATQGNIFRALDHLTDTVKPEDIVFIYFAGHGILKNNIEEGYWIPVDGERDNYGSFVANSLMTKYLKSIKSLHTVVVADACFAGAMFGERDFKDISIERQEKLNSRWLLTSCRDTTAIDKDQKPNSPFADSLLLHLKTNENAALPVTALAKSIIYDLGNNYEQLPRCAPLYGVGDRGGEFVFRLKGSVEHSNKTDRHTAPETFQGGISKQPMSIQWQRLAFWALGAVFTVASLLLGYNFFFGTSKPEKTTLTVKTETINIGDIKVGQRKIFLFEVFNTGKTTATVNDIRASCHNVVILDSVASIIAANSKRTYRAEWVAEQPASGQQCQIVVGGPNVAEQVLVLVEASVIAAPLEPDKTIDVPPDPIPGPVTSTQKARIVAETTTIIDLKEIGLGSERTFAFKLKNTSSIKANMSQPTASCSAVTVAKGGGTNTILPNALGVYGGVWKANQLGAQQCTITIGGSNVEQAVRIVVKANVVKLPPAPPRQSSNNVCKITCRTNGRIGVIITLVDSESNKDYNATTDGTGDANFSVPCDLIGKTVKVYVRTPGGAKDNFSTTLERFISIPD